MFIITSSRENLMKTLLLVHLVLINLRLCEKKIDHKQIKEFRISGKINRKFHLNRLNMLNNYNLQSVTEQCDPSSHTKLKIPLIQQNKYHTVYVYMASCIYGYLSALNNASPGWKRQDSI